MTAKRLPFGLDNSHPVARNPPCISMASEVNYDSGKEEDTARPGHGHADVDFHGLCERASTGGGGVEATSIILGLYTARRRC